VTDSWVRGKRLMSSREVHTLPMDTIRANAAKWGAKVTEKLQEMKSSS